MVQTLDSDSNRSRPTVGIGEAAAAVGRTAHTLRYYESIGLVRGVTRNASGHRQYTFEQIRWLRFLDRLRFTQMPIARMREYARLAARGASSLPDRYRLLEAHRADLEAQIGDLNRCLSALEVKMGRLDDSVPDSQADSREPSPESACLSAPSQCNAQIV